MNYTTDKFKTIDWLSPLPIPESYREKAFRISTGHQLVIALMLNILSLAIPIMMLQVYDRIIPHQSYGTLSLLTLGVFVALALDATLRVVRSWLVGWTAASNEHVASCAAVDHFNRSDLTAFEKISPGEHMQNLNALGRLREFYSGQALTALIDLPFAVIFLALVAYLGGWLVLVPLILLAVFALCARTAGLRLKKALEQRHDADDKKSSTVVSILSGIHSVKALGLESTLMRQYEDVQEKVSKESFRVAMASGIASTLGSTFGQLSLILTAAAGCLMVINSDLSVGGLSACTLLAGRAIQPIQRVLGTWLRLQDLSIARTQAQNLFALPARELVHKRSAPYFLGNIFLDRVTFGYTPDGPSLLKNISIDVKSGRSVAITGTKSSGKSTLLQLIAGTLSPSSGSVLIDEINPAEYSMSDLIGQVGYLPQEGGIFRGTILDNITGFRDDETSVRSAKEMAAELGLDNVIDFLPYGYQTVLTDTTADPIPPGIKQRIALCRVLRHRPRVLLFDDADRALDKEGYNRLFRIIGKLKGSCTIVMVSHDMNLLSFCDETYHLNGGSLQRHQGGGAQTISHLTFAKGLE
jgi:ATP-binding cassette subfamily C protein LapB